MSAVVVVGVAVAVSEGVAVTAWAAVEISDLVDIALSGAVAVLIDVEA